MARTVPANPYRFHDELKELYLQKIREGGRRLRTARQLGIDPKTVQRHMWDEDEDGRKVLTDFGRAVMEAEAEADDEVVDALRLSATGGVMEFEVPAPTDEDPERVIRKVEYMQPNTTALQVWLYNRRPDEWRDQRRLNAELTGADGGPIQIETSARESLFERIRAMTVNLQAGTALAIEAERTMLAQPGEDDVAVPPPTEDPDPE